MDRNKLLVLLFFISAFLGLYGQETFSDQFNVPLYNANNGSMNFSGPWIENGETSDPTAGRIDVFLGQLRIRNMDGVTIERSLDLSAATAATLTFTYTEISGNEQIAVQLFNGTSWTTRAILNGNGNVNYTLTAAERNANAGVRFISNSGGWGNTEEYRIDNVTFTATIPTSVYIDDVSVDEGAGTVTITARHVGPNTLGPFSVNYSSTAISATNGVDYNDTAGTWFFNGFTGDTQTVTITILDDTLYELDEVFEVRMNTVSNPGVIITDVGITTITDNEVVLGNTPLALFQEFDGYIDYTSTGATFRTQDNNTNACSIGTTASNTLTTAIPAGSTIERAVLYWSNSGQMDPQVTFEGQNVDADLVYRTTILGLEFHNQSADVTSIVQGIADPNSNVFDVTNLTIDNTGNYCAYAVTLGGWSLMVFYSNPAFPASTINLYQGFDGNQNSTSTFTLSGFYAIGSTGSKTTVLSWEGDQTLANNESLQFNTPLTGTNLLMGDGDNTGGANPFNSTVYDNVGVPLTNDATQYGVDLDTYDVSSFILPGENTATTVVNVGQDFVMMNAVVLKVPSNIIVGRIFEDINYGGGPGRDRITAGDVGIPNASVELYDDLNALVTTTTSNATGQYTFAGMRNGDYKIRVINESVRSTRPGGSACLVCRPVQTFKADFQASSLIPNTNLVGGANPAGADPPSGTIAGAQSVADVTINSEGVVGLDFGFNFNTIVNTNENGQGSLEQFILNSNNIGEGSIDIEANGIFDPAAGEDLSVFMIPAPGDALGRTADVNYTAGIFNITLTGSTLSTITGDNTVIDGRTQTAYSGDTNSGTVGSGGSTVGTSATALPNYDRPEILVDQPAGDVFVNEGNNVTLRNLAIVADDRSAIVQDDGILTVLNNLVGVNATGLNQGNLLRGIEVNRGTTTIEGNFISTTRDNAILITGGDATTVLYNHLTNNGDAACEESIDIQGGDGILVQYNLIEQSAGDGISAMGMNDPFTIEETTITSSGRLGGSCLSGIRSDGDDAIFRNNVIHTNGGAGLTLENNGRGNLISQNSFFANGTIAAALGIDLDGDGVTLNDDGDGDNGPNRLMNFPIIQIATTNGSNMIVQGWSRPGATIEFFLTDVNQGSAATGDNKFAYASDYGEGETYLFTVVEGSGSDLDNTSSNYTDVDGNTDNTNKFRFIVPAPPGVNIGSLVTATATISGSTSEFSPMSELKVPTIITNRRITFRVRPN